jgi:virginiamycin B lyase
MEVLVPGGPYALAAGPDDALWVTLVHAGEVARVAGDDVRRFAVGEKPQQIVAGPDGALWFTLADSIGRLSTSGALSTFPAERPYGICVGPDGGIWVTDADSVRRVGGDVFALPKDSFPAMITAGPDGALWFTLNAASAVGRLTLDGRLEVRETPTPRAGPVGIAATHDAVWFTEILAGRLGRIPMDDAIQELELGDVKPHAVIAAPADGVFVSLWGSGEVAHVSFDGEVAIIPVGPEPHGMAIGPDEGLWVALEGGTVARIAGA